MILCFYHGGDLDGKCAGAIVKHKFPECVLFPIDHGEKFPWETIDKRDIVYMVDFCLQPFEDMIRLHTSCEELIWIDHHKSSMEIEEKVLAQHVKDLPTISGIREIGKAACELTWEYLFPNKPMSLIVSLLGRYDVWDLRDARTLPLQFGVNSQNTNPGSWLWTHAFEENVDTAFFTNELAAKGGIILAFVQKKNKEFCEKFSFELEFAGLRCIAINKQPASSKIFDAVWDPKKHDIMLAFGWKRNKWVVSLYTDKPEIDVSKLAVARGGGGHKQAAGFVCDEVPFLYFA